MSSMYPSFGQVAARQCVRCGAPLAPQENQCSRCGTFSSPPPQNQQFGGFQAGPGPLEPSRGGPLPQTPSQSLQGGNAFPPGVGGWGAVPGAIDTGSPQNNLFAGQPQAAAPAFSPQASLFSPPFGTGQLGQPQAGPNGSGQPGWNNPHQSGFSNSVSSPLNNPNQPNWNNPHQSGLHNSLSSPLNNPNQPNWNNPNQSGMGNLGQPGFGNPVSSPLNNPNQSGFNNAFGSFQQNTNQPPTNSFFSTTQQSNFGTSSANMQNNSIQSGWQSYQQNRLHKPVEEEEEESGRKKPPILVIVLLVVLVLALVGGGGYGALSFLRNRNGANNTATNTAPIATPTGAPLFKDTFQNNNNGWNETNPQGASITISNGKLVMESDNNKLFEELLPQSTSYGDLRVDVNASLTKGNQANGYGIYIRGALGSDGSLSTYYRFEVYASGGYAIYKGSVDTTGAAQSKTIVSNLNAAVLTGQQVNHLTVIAKGSQMTFEINGTSVYTFSDTTYKGGLVALFVSNVSSVAAGAQATFTNLAIFPAQ